jgi:hypothetical protein
LHVRVDGGDEVDFEYEEDEDEDEDVDLENIYYSAKGTSDLYAALLQTKVDKPFALI